MGTSASAHKTAVRSISIDQNGWSRPCSASRTSSATSRRSLPFLSNFIGDKSSRGGTLTIAERMKLVDRALRAEAAAADCESKMKGMEREIRTLELRNHDLSTEVCWLRQQCTIACPDVPNGSVATFVPPSCSEQCQVERKVLHDTVAEQNVDLNRLRLDVERLTAVDMRKDIRISELIKELDSAKSRIIGLEELCRNQIGGLTLSTSSCEAKKEMVEETVPGEGEKTGIIEVAEEGREDTPSEKPFGGPAKNSNLRILTSRRRPTLRNIFTMGKQPGIDGKVRPSTAAGTSSAIPFVPPPLERGETVPILRSMEIMWGIPHGNEEHDKKSNIIGNPSCADKGTTLDSDADSDIDVTDILECSHKSTTLSQRSQSSKSRDSGFCRGESISTRSLSNKPIV